MKRTFLITSLLMMSYYAHSQFIVDSISHIGVKINPDTNYVVKVKSETGQIGGIYCSRASNLTWPTSDPWSEAIYGQTSHRGVAYSQGLRGISAASSPTGTGRCFGVFGAAQNATDGYNYGVYGVILGTTKGAGIYGSSYANHYAGQALTQRYAGYFYGPVKVQGDLTVTGNISGVMLSSPSPSSGMLLSTNHEQRLSASVTESLGALEVKSFYPKFRSTLV